VSPSGSAAFPPSLLAQLERARALGFLGPGPVEDHLRHAAGFLAALEGASGPVADLGSGAGVPGLAIATARPDLELVLIDAGERRARFLGEAVEALGLGGRVRVVRGRAEAVGRGELRGACGAVVARGFGQPAPTAECAAPLLRVGGLLVVSEPPEPADRWPPAALAELGLAPRKPAPDGPRIQVLEQVATCPDAYPRRDGVPAKRPLF
jgi:16S rRNA (guanine527-N7)-methyltransferase